jgi:hypothetical protein
LLEVHDASHWPRSTIRARLAHVVVTEGSAGGRLASSGAAPERSTRLPRDGLAVLLGREVVGTSDEFPDSRRQVRLAAALVIDDPNASVGDRLLKPKRGGLLATEPGRVGGNHDVERPRLLGERGAGCDDAGAILDGAADRVVFEDARDGPAARLGKSSG